MHTPTLLLASVLSLTSLAARTANERCPVTGLDVRNHLLCHYVTLGGRNYYVYDRTAANRLRQSPGSFLREDGSLRLAPPAAEGSK